MLWERTPEQGKAAADARLTRDPHRCASLAARSICVLHHTPAKPKSAILATKVGLLLTEIIRIIGSLAVSQVKTDAYKIGMHCVALTQIPAMPK